VSGDIEDERRLFYVAITRAKQSLSISYADIDVTGREKLPSLFIEDLNAERIDVEHDVVDATKIFFAPRLQNVASLVSLEYIREKFLDTQLSATALNNYFDSPLLYFFRNLVRLPSVQNKTLLYGSILHASLEKFFVLSHEQGEVLAKDILLESFDIALKTMNVPMEYYDSIQRRGREALGGYYDKYKDSFSIDVVLEKKIKAVSFELDSGEQIILTGAIDKMETLDDGSVSVVDYKTGKPWSRLQKDKKESLSRQVVFYKLLLNEYNDGQYNMSQGMLDFIEPHPDTHEFEREIVSVCDGDVDKLREEINMFANDILSGEFLSRDINKKYGDTSLDEYIKLLKILKQNDRFK